MSILTDGTQELHSYLFMVRDSIFDNSTKLDAIKSALVELLVYLCSPEGRTTENCTTTDTLEHPDTATNFESTPEQLLTRAHCLSF
jgi:hypothetical protein